MKTIIILFLTASLISSCSNKKNTAQTVDSEVEVHKPKGVTNEVLNEEKNKESLSKFIISFYSPGNGIDYKTKKEYDDFLTKEYANLEVHQKSWGREGEVDYCVNIELLTKKEKASFVLKSIAILNKSSKINYSNSDSCKK